jgi:hypothetical protein
MFLSRMIAQLKPLSETWPTAHNSSFLKPRLKNNNDTAYLY